MKKIQNNKKSNQTSINSIASTLKFRSQTFHTRSMIDFDSISTNIEKQNYSNNLKSTKYLSPLCLLQSQSKIGKIRTPQRNKSTNSKQNSKNIMMVDLKNIRKVIQDKKQKQPQKDQNYDLLVKLRSYIEQMKKKQEIHDKQMQKIKQDNQKLKQQNYKINLQNSNLKKNINQTQNQISNLQIRTIDLQKIIKQYQKKNIQLQRDKDLIVQSLKRVIDQQMTKIIYLERQILHSKALNTSQATSFNNTQKYISKDSTKFNHHLSQSYQISQNENDVILEVTEENQTQNQDNSISNDNILTEVDNYLSKFQSKFQ